jgi:hypothetical protein
MFWLRQFTAPKESCPAKKDGWHRKAFNTILSVSTTFFIFVKNVATQCDTTFFNTGVVGYTQSVTLTLFIFAKNSFTQSDKIEPHFLNEKNVP